MRSLLGQPLVSQIVEKIDPVYGYDDAVVGYRFNLPVDAERFDQAGGFMLALLAPARKSLVVQELARLHLLTASREQHDIDYEASLAAYAEELAVFPPDVVTSVLRAYAKTHRFFPALAELYEPCEQAVSNRRMMARAVGVEI